MKPGELIAVTHNVTGGGKVRRAVRIGEIGVLIDTHYNNDLRQTIRLWCNVLMHDGLIWIPGWCVRRVGDDDDTSRERNDIP